MGAAGTRAVAQTRPVAPASTPEKTLALKDFQPHSMLHTAETRVERSRFPVIDIHTHLSWSAKGRGGVFLGEQMEYLAPPADLLAVMDRRNIKTLVNLTGGFGAGLIESVKKYDAAQPGRFITFTEPSWTRINSPVTRSSRRMRLGGRIARARKA